MSIVQYLPGDDPDALSNVCLRSICPRYYYVWYLSSWKFFQRVTPTDSWVTVWLSRWPAELVAMCFMGDRDEI